MACTWCGERILFHFKLFHSIVKKIYTKLMVCMPLQSFLKKIIFLLFKSFVFHRPSHYIVELKWQIAKTLEDLYSPDTLSCLFLLNISVTNLPCFYYFFHPSRWTSSLNFDKMFVVSLLVKMELIKCPKSFHFTHKILIPAKFSNFRLAWYIK